MPIERKSSIAHISTVTNESTERAIRKRTASLIPSRTVLRKVAEVFCIRLFLTRWKRADFLSTVRRQPQAKTSQLYSTARQMLIATKSRTLQSRIAVKMIHTQLPARNPLGSIWKRRPHALMRMIQIKMNPNGTKVTGSPA